MCTHRVASRVDLSAFALVESNYVASAFEIALARPIPRQQTKIEDEATVEIGKGRNFKTIEPCCHIYQIDRFPVHGNCSVLEVQF